MSLIDDVLQPVQSNTGPVPPERFFAQLFSGQQLPDLGPISSFADGAKKFLDNVPKDNALAAVLDVVQRPSYAVASATEKALRGGNVQDIMGAAGAGFTGQQHTRFGDVLKEQGVPEGPSLGPVSLRDVAGTALDIATDPLTYLSFGGSAAGKFGATKLAVPFTGIEKTILPFDGVTTVAHLFDSATNVIPKVPEIKTAITDAMGQVFVSNYGLKRAGFDDIAEGLQVLRRAPGVYKEEAINLVANKLAPLDPAQREVFFKAADTGWAQSYIDKSGAQVLGTGDEAVDTLLHWYRGEYAPALEAIKGKMGLTSYLDNYIRHVFPEKLAGPGAGAPLQLRKPGSFLQREGAEGYSTDPVLAIAFDRAQTMVRKETNDFVDTTLAKYGQKLKPDEPLSQGMVEYFPKGKQSYFPVTTDTGSQVLAVGQSVRYAVPQEIGDALNKLVSPKETLGLLKAFDTVQSIWKASVTSLFPAFHMRNELGNVFQNSIAGVSNPAVYLDAAKLQRATEPAKLAVSAAGKVVDATSPDAAIALPEFLQTLKLKGALSTGYFGADMPSAIGKFGQTESGLADLAAKVGLDPKTADHLQWIDYGYQMQKMGVGLEDNAKIAHVLGQMGNGMGVDDAINSAKKYLFDYGDLSDAERTLFKRVIPFYTWTRKNIPLQLEKLATDPRQAAAVGALTGIMGTDNMLSDQQKALMPQYVAEQFNVSIDNHDPAHPKLLTGLGLPIEDLNKLWSLDGQNTFQNLMQNASPLLKTPLEIIFGKSLFTGKEITDASLSNYYRKVNGMLGDVPGLKQWLDIKEVAGKDRNGNPQTYYEADPMKNYLLLATLGRLDATASKFTNDTMSPEQKVLAVLTGTKIASPDLARPLVAFDLAQRKVLDERNFKLDEAAQKVADTQPGSENRDLAMLTYRTDRADVLKEYAIRLDQARQETAQQMDLSPEKIAAGELNRRGLLDPNQLALDNLHSIDPASYPDLHTYFKARDAFVASLPADQQAYLQAHQNTWINDLPPTARAIESGYQNAMASMRQYMAIQPFNVPLQPDKLHQMQVLDELYRAQPNDWMRAQFKAVHPELALYDRLRQDPNPRRKLFIMQHPEIRAFGLVSQIRAPG